MTIKRLLTLALAALMLAALLPATALAEEPITLHMLFAVRGLMAPTRENAIRDAILEATGIDVDLEIWYFTSEEELNARLNMWGASGELPFDFFFGVGGAFVINTYHTMGEMGMLKNLEPYILSSEAMTAFCAHTFPRYRDPNDGGIYCYPYHLNAPEYFTARDVALSIRVDWMEALGMDYPTSPEEYYELLKAIKDEYNVIPLTTNDGSGLEVMGAQFLGLYGTGRWEKDAEGVYRIPMFTNYDRTIEFGLFMNKLWREGLLDQEAFTQKNEQLIEKLSTGQAAAALSLRHSTQASINDILWQDDPNALLAFMPSFPVEGVPVAGVTTLTNWGGSLFVANANVSEEKMEALVRYWEWLLTKEGTILTFMGVEGVNYVINEDGLCEFIPEFIEQYPTENERQEYGLWHYQMPAASWFRIDQYAAPKPEYSRRDYMENLANYNDKLVLDDLVYGVFAGEVEQLRMPAINEAWTQTLVKAIMASSAEECQSILEGFLPTLNNLGYDAICQERTELTAKMAATLN